MANNLGMTGILVAGFVLLLLGAVLVGPISSEGLSKTSFSRASETISIPRNGTAGAAYDVNETINTTLGQPPIGWKLNDCLLSNINVTNSSRSIQFTSGTDYVLSTTTGIIQWLNTSDTGKGGNAYNNLSIVSYSYCGDDYLNSSWGRTVLNLVPGFFAIAVMLAGVGIFFSIGKQAGIV